MTPLANTRGEVLELLCYGAWVAISEIENALWFFEGNLAQVRSKDGWAFFRS